MGRTKTPEKVKESRENAALVVVAPGAPEIPRPLSRLCRAEWNRLVPVLLELGTLTPADGPALATYCETIERYMICHSQVKLDGLTTTGAHGAVAHPLLQEMRACQRFMRDFENDFGMRHLARTRIKTKPKEEKAIDPFDAFLAEKPSLPA